MSTPGVETGSARGSRTVVFASLGGVFATSFPSVVLVASLATIGDELDATASTMAWVIVAPMLASSVGMPLMGKLGDSYGHRRVYMSGLVVATAMTAATAAAWDPLSLILFRTVGQAAGSATQPASVAMIIAVLPADERARGMGYWSLVSAGAPTLGLVVGGPVIDAVGWRSLFVMQSGLALLALVVAAVFLTATATGPRRRLDLPGAFTLGATAACLMFALNRGEEWGVAHPGVLATLALAPVFAASFRWVEQRAVEPLLPLGFLQLPGFRTPVVAEFCVQAATMGAFVISPLLMRSELGFSVADASFALLPLPVSMSVLSPLGGRLAVRWGERPVAQIAAATQLISMVVLVAGFSAGSPVAVVAGLILLGGANGLARPSLNGAAANAMPEEYFGVGMATFRMVSQLGAASGVTLLVALEPAGMAVAFGTGGVLAAVAGIMAGRLTESRRPAPVDQPV